MKEFSQIISDIKNKVYHPVYFLMGEEPYFIDAITSEIENNVLDENEKEFNQTVLYGRDTDINTIISHAKRFPMMANHQVVIIKEAQNVKDMVPKQDDDDKKKEKKKEKGPTPFQLYLENPQKSTILVICYKYKTLDKRTAIAKLIDKSSVLFESKKLYDDKLPDWIAGFLKSKKITIEPKAAVLLAEYLGNDLSKIVNELDKISINMAGRKEVTVDDIQQNVGISKEYNTFELQDAIGKKDVLRANRIVNYFASNSKEFPLVMTLGILSGYFTKLLVYHSLSDKSRNNAAAALGVHPFFMTDYEKAARNFSPAKIKNIFSGLREYDLKSKGYDSAGIPEGELLKELVFKILH